jgi:putative ABC transport system permease protein
MHFGFWGELRHSARQLIRTRAFTLPALAGLALGIGATTAVFSIVHTMLLRSMGFTQTDRLVALWQTDLKRGQKHVEVCWADLIEWRKQTAIFEEVALASSVNLDFPLTGDGKPQQVDGTTVTGNFFRLLGAIPQAGRLFTDDDDVPGAPPRVVISDRLWRTRFGGDRGIAGRQIQVGGGSVTVIGVASPEFDFPRDVDIWAPLRTSWPTVEKQPRFRVFRSVARMRPGVTVPEAQAHLSLVASQVERTLPAGSQGFGVLVTPMLEEIFGAAHKAAWLMLGAVALVLVIACANVANLLLARATVRSREIAIRAVLGASRGRLVRFLLTESVLLGAFAGGAGLALATLGVEVLVRMAPADVPRIGQVTLDAPVLLFGIGLTFATVVLFGLAPAMITSDRDPQEALQRASTRASASRGHTRLRAWLIAGEVALAVVLLVGAGLLLRTFSRLAGLDGGFNPERVLTFRVTLGKPDQESRRLFYTQVLERMRALPGVESAGAVLIRPLSGIVGWDTIYQIEGQTQDEQLRNPNGNYEAVSPDYFRTMGIRLIAGRDFTTADTEKAQGVVIINESTARRHWPGQSAVGKHLRLGRDAKAPWLEVVGVVNDVRYREWEAVRPDLYVPYTQRAQHRSDFVVKTKRDPAALIAAVQREVLAIDPNQAISNVTTMQALVDRALARSRFNSTILGVLAVCALALAAIGIYGLLSYSVAQRRNEIGIRLALGATPGRIVALVAAGGFRMAAAGAGVGIVAAALLSPLVEAQLYDVTRLDPVSYSGAAIALGICALAACVVPAMRAAIVDPVRALQGD